MEENLRRLFRELAAARQRWPLYLFGGVGAGKTFAALGLCDVTRRAFYATAEETADWIVRPDYNWQAAGDADLAVLDELGARLNVGDLHYQAVYRFAEIRQRRPTIYLSNLAPEDLRRVYDERIASRLLCGCWYEISGGDRRMV